MTIPREHFFWVLMSMGPYAAFEDGPLADQGIRNIIFSGVGDHLTVRCSAHSTQMAEVAEVKKEFTRKRGS